MRLNGIVKLRIIRVPVTHDFASSIEMNFLLADELIEQHGFA
jgi:hypothetical protein